MHGSRGYAGHEDEELPLDLVSGEQKGLKILIFQIKHPNG